MLLKFSRCLVACNDCGRTFEPTILALDIRPPCIADVFRVISQHREVGQVDWNDKAVRQQCEERRLDLDQCQ